VKFFLTAAPEARARRRFDGERGRAGARDFEAALADINDSDLRDATRADSPLAIADDAVVIDTTELSAEEVFQTMLRTVQSRQAGGDKTG
ncbi:MAG TPA: (d)CMP kinase, partial [Pyrinomonadaceae bacterium]